MYHGKQLMDRSDNAATTTDSSAMCHRQRPRAAAGKTKKSESLPGNSIRIISPARTGGLTRKKPDEIEERHRLENGRSNGGTGRRSRQRRRTRTLHEVARRLDHIRE